MYFGYKVNSTYILFLIYLELIFDRLKNDSCLGSLLQYVGMLAEVYFDIGLWIKIKLFKEGCELCGRFGEEKVISSKEVTHKLKKGIQ